MPASGKHTILVIWLAIASCCGPGAVAAKPDHCRPDLPGCCPKKVDHVLLLHIEKTGGTSVRTFLQSAVKKRFRKGTICNYLSKMPYQCTPSSALGGEPDCNAKQAAYYAADLASGKHFKRECKLTSSHHDWRFIQAVPPALRNTTLLIVNLREPAERLVSHFHMLRRHGDAAALNSTVADYFMRSADGEAVGRNRMARMLAGEFCCRGGAKADYDSPALLSAALAHLDEFCVVGLTSRVQDTMVYVQHALDQVTSTPPKELHYHNNYHKYQPVAEELLKALRKSSAHDVKLYAAAERRFEEQMKAIGRQGGAGGKGAKAGDGR